MYKTHRYPTRDGAAGAAGAKHGQKHGRRAALGDITNNSAAGNANAKAGKVGKMSKPSFSVASSSSSSSSSAAASSRSRSLARGPVRDVDANDRRNPQMCTTYVNEIFDHLRVVENQPGYTPTSTFISKQKDINEKMRAILYDWIVEVHLKFKLKPETLYLTMNIMDRCECGGTGEGGRGGGEGGGGGGGGGSDRGRGASGEASQRETDASTTVPTPPPPPPTTIPSPRQTPTRSRPQAGEPQEAPAARRHRAPPRLQV